MSSTLFTFDHNFRSKTWSHSRTRLPLQFESLDISLEEWGKFWDEAQATAERSVIRKDLFDMKIKSLKEKFDEDNTCSITDKEKKELAQLQEEMKADWKKLSYVAESMFAQIQAHPSSKSIKIQHFDEENEKKLFEALEVEYFGLEIQICNQNYEKYSGKRVLFYFDERRQKWSLPRSPIPKELLDLGVKAKDWFEFYDYASGVKERSDLRRKENEGHTARIVGLIHFARGDTYANPDSDKLEGMTPISRIQKIEAIKKENDENTMKGWGVLQRKVKNIWMGPKGVYVGALLRGKYNECYGVVLHTDPDYKPSEQDLKNEELFKSLGQKLEPKQKEELEQKRKDEETSQADPLKTDPPETDPLENAVLFYFDESKGNWSLSRSPVPKELSDLGVTEKDWFDFYDYAIGVKERADLRRKENEKHTRSVIELIHLAREEPHTSSYEEDNNSVTPRSKIKKFEEVKRENDENTMKGWGVLQRKASTSMGPKGIYVEALLRGKYNECYGVALHTDPDYKSLAVLQCKLAVTSEDQGNTAV